MTCHLPRHGARRGRRSVERIARGPIPVDEAIPIALQIAEALEAAHEQGIVHRDLKPANIKITDGRHRQGARLRARQGLGDRRRRLVAVPVSHHDPARHGRGLILGTAAYMSPEQARGKKVDRRADIWAFGVVLWEMLTGHKLFEGETVSDVLASVLKETPSLDALPSDLPPSVRRVVARCLERDPRLGSSGSATPGLNSRDAEEPLPPMCRVPPPSNHGDRRLPWMVAASAAAVASILASSCSPAASRNGA